MLLTAKFAKLEGSTAFDKALSMLDLVDFVVVDRKIYWLKNFLKRAKQPKAPTTNAKQSKAAK